MTDMNQSYSHLEIYNDDVVLLIPALDPDSNLTELIERLIPVWHCPVVLVDDGSCLEAKAEIFSRAEGMGCKVLTHTANLGKGRGLKTGFNYILNEYPDSLGCVTADADGQHLVKDIIACADALRESPDALILGCRDFSDPNVPPKSKFGNKLTRSFMSLFSGVNVTDTQTGLRAIPSEFARRLMNLNGERFEFETNMLLETVPADVPIKEVFIDTVYIEQNRATHFNPIKDSIKIYSLLFRSCRKALLEIAVAAAVLLTAVKLIKKLTK